MTSQRRPTKKVLGYRIKTGDLYVSYVYRDARLTCATTYAPPVTLLPMEEAKELVALYNGKNAIHARLVRVVKKRKRAPSFRGLRSRLGRLHLRAAHLLSRLDEAGITSVVVARAADDLRATMRDVKEYLS